MAAHIRTSINWLAGCLAASACAHVHAQDDGWLSTPGRAWSLAVDNDLFGPAQSDRDYTGGFVLSISGPQTADYWWTLDPLLAGIERLVSPKLAAAPARSAQHAVQVGLLTFTPEDLLTSDVLPDERPYASLLFGSATRQYVAADEHSIRYGELTLGALGLSVTADLHDAIHRAVGSDPPRGYGNQISRGGEPTLRYTMGSATLRARRLALGDQLLEVRTAWAASVGYLTETSYAVSARIGDIESPWWTFNPERADYIAAASPAAGRWIAADPEWYMWAGARVTLRAYNGFLQGQFRNSAHTFSAGELNHVIGQVWIGLTGELPGGAQLSYVVRYQTAEVRRGPASRDHVWAGVTISRSF